MKRPNSTKVDIHSRSTSPDLRDIKRKLNLATNTSTKYRQCKSASYQSTTIKKKNIAEANKKNHDLCDACGGAGQFLCCDACPRAFHLTCVEPPMDTEDLDNLSDKWFCNECEQKRNKAKSPKADRKGLFSELIEDVTTRNPMSYALPDDIIDFFEDVAADKEGDYIDVSSVKRVRYRNGEAEQPDYHQLKDKHGNYILCYQCRKTAFTKPMIGCDYCTLHWHLDCLKPPMASPPNPAKKWRCPNHIEHLVKPPRRQKDPVVITANQPACTYHNYLHTIVDDEKPRPQEPNYPDTVIPRPDGVSYSIPFKSVKLDMESYIRKWERLESHGYYQI